MRRKLPLIPFHLLSLPLAMAATSAPSTLPQVDFSRMGTVGLSGAFDGLDWWSSSSPFASSSSSSSSISFSTTGDTLFTTSSDGTYQPLGSTNPGGVINAVCWANSSSNGTLYIGGSFTSISSTTSANIITYDLSSSSFHIISPGLSGPVQSLYCDNAHGQVWVGGEFTGPSGGGNNVALWSTGSSTWTAVPFQGLNGAVESIQPSANGSSIYFGGAFTTTFQSNTTTNSTTNTTSIQSAPNGTWTTGNSGYLTPVTMPAVSSSAGGLTITAGPSTDQSQYSDPTVLLCPGSGTWLAQDNTISNVDVLGNSYWRASGVRLTNALIQNRGATGFCVTALPDNVQLNMTYTDPVTGQTNTCWDHCPLYTNSSISGQDFLFTAGVQNMTGLQMQLKTWIGDGAGLSSVQVLSDAGAFASAATAGNTGSCSTQKSSDVQTTGNWSTESVVTNIPATTAYYLSTTVAVGDSDRPSVTFYPYISAAGYYDVYMLIPGCTNTEHCEGRTSVDIEVFPMANGLGWTSTISEQVTDDAKALVYSGWMDATSSSFNPTVILALAASPDAPSSGSTYYIVAEAVELRLTGVSGANGTTLAGGTTSGSPTVSSSMNTTQMTGSSIQVAFGVYEYVRTTSTLNAASSLSNTTETALTQLGFGLIAAKNASTSSTSFTVNTFVTSDTMIYVGGEFSASSNYSNVISVDTTTGKATELASQGLNGPVYTSAIIGGYIFFGGDFTSTVTGGVTLNNLARYDPKAQAWAAIGGGVNGVVTTLLPSPTSSSQLIVVGNFSQVTAGDGSVSQTGGYATWDTSSSSWSNSGVIFGNLTTIGSSSNQIYLAGKVSGYTQNGANGIATLSTDSDGSAQISSLPGATFSTTGSASSPSTRRRSFSESVRRSVTAQLQALEARLTGQTSHLLTSRASTAPTIAQSPAVAPAVLSGTFWTNSSASGKPTVYILGGNFSSTTSSPVKGVGFYSDDQLSGPSPPVSGLVQAVDVVNNVLYVGGNGVSVSGAGSTILAYDLQKGQWSPNSIPSLNPASGGNVSVNAISQRLKTNTVVAAGQFATAGSLNCAAVCLWDIGSGRWNTPGTGLQSGEVKSIDFVGNQLEILVVGGSFVMSTGTVAYAATYSFDNSTWTTLDGLPGPVLAIASDDRNGSNIFASGYSTSDSTPYLQRWDGSSWTSQNSTLLPGSIVQQLAFVPMTSEHSGQGSIEKDRMLMISGSLILQNQGNVSSALFDGTNWYPYLIGTTSTGSLGSISKLFWSSDSFSFNIHHYLSRGLVVLVAIAIATGLILLLILLYVLDTQVYEKRYLNRNEPEAVRVNKEALQPYWDNTPNSSNVDQLPQSKNNQVGMAGYMASVHAALRASLGVREVQHDDMTGMIEDRRRSDEDGDSEESEDWRETTMRYDFEADGNHPGELSMKQGQRVEINERLDSSEWWYARDPHTGKEGIVPQSYGEFLLLLSFPFLPRHS
ncbi:hypothetical protein TREMEDRAFT_42413 [Tremella mesenterica DSM 1558]|uniref:uncharacterized protein n=1 Tax=Tremella mesenterica (strain ATCC 24925 / CBS 8224 / DSM 1558 / NBRC 9311 / NRRL Y-6157 / RJB 2259-6 / UBC 559-6) TaxID=578456 RepID=UPI0003F49D58|nr:uncharacterized protein TREMEDRAFT_42413 [Tremella mesenterica DSM 1558]EIW73555.1 hypothetical protein TREMEDRAFT_42413 [Tremella mesenterica DSM 1558]